MSNPSELKSASPVPLEYAAGRITHFRWVILALIFLGTTINYVDRLVLGLLSADLQERYSISASAYGWIGSAFGIAYAFGQLASGGILDRIGTRLGYALALAAWSIFQMVTALGRGAISFSIVRAMLGVTQSPAFPAAAKACAEWFPRRERAFAFAFVNTGSNAAAIIAPLTIPFLAIHYGWQVAFVVPGIVGLLLLILWLPLYKKPAEHPRVSEAELNLINSDPPEPATPIPWATILTYRQAWVFAIGKFLTDAMWWFYMTWLPLFFYRHHGLNLRTIGWPLVTIYVMATLGAVGGGYLSSAMMSRGMSVNAARKTALLVSAIFALPIMFAQQITSLWPAVLVLGLATAAHQGFSSNLYTLCSDLFPRRAVASVAGLGGMCGWIGASLFQPFTGYWVQYTENYIGPFVCAGLAYVGAFVLIHLLSPSLSPARIDLPNGGAV